MRKAERVVDPGEIVTLQPRAPWNALGGLPGLAGMAAIVIRLLPSGAQVRTPCGGLPGTTPELTVARDLEAIAGVPGVLVQIGGTTNCLFWELAPAGGPAANARPPLCCSGATSVTHHPTSGAGRAAMPLVGTCGGGFAAVEGTKSRPYLGTPGLAQGLAGSRQACRGEAIPLPMVPAAPLGEHCIGGVPGRGKVRARGQR